MNDICHECGHGRDDHAAPGFRSYLFCEYPSCDCHDFRESKPPMTSREFCYWLQGFFELRCGDHPIAEQQARLIEKHLALVFKHEIDPSQGDAAHQGALNAIHGDESRPRC